MSGSALNEVILETWRWGFPCLQLMAFESLNCFSWPASFGTPELLTEGQGSVWTMLALQSWGPRVWILSIHGNPGWVWQPACNLIALEVEARGPWLASLGQSVTCGFSWVGEWSRKKTNVYIWPHTHAHECVPTHIQTYIHPRERKRRRREEGGDMGRQRERQRQSTGEKPGCCFLDTP